MQKNFIRFTMLFLLLLLSLSPGYASDGRTIVDNLYMSSGSLPINDLVADMEVWGPMDKQQGGSALQLRSKDKIFFKKPNKIKTDIIINDPGGSTDGQQMTIIRDGVNCFHYLPQGQYPVKKKPDEPSPTLNLPPNIQTYPQDANKSYTLVGEEAISGISCKVVRIVDSSNDETTTIWVDTSKWVPVKLEKKIPPAKGTGEPTVKTANYREFKQLKDGRWFPFVIEIQTAGQTSRLVIYKAISVNVGLQDHLFEPMSKFIK